MGEDGFQGTDGECSFSTPNLEASVLVSLGSSETEKTSHRHASGQKFLGSPPSLHRIYFSGSLLSHLPHLVDLLFF